MRQPTTITFVLCIATAAFADGTTTIRHVECAAYAELSRLPLARIEGAARANADSDRLRDAHMSEALKLGVPLVDEESRFPGILKPGPIGGSAEAGIGFFLASVVTIQNDLFELRHGAPPTKTQSLDDRFEQLADWYRLRAAEMTSRYEVARCTDLL